MIGHEMLSENVHFEQVGGVINPPDCMEVASTSDIVRIGDVCVSPFANNWCDF